MVRFCCLAILSGTLSLFAAAQDTLYGPRGQQIPAPECLNLQFASRLAQPACIPNMHELWLKDIQH